MKSGAGKECPLSPAELALFSLLLLPCFLMPRGGRRGQSAIPVGSLGEPKVSSLRIQAFAVGLCGSERGNSHHTSLGSKRQRDDRSPQPVLAAMQDGIHPTAEASF